MSGWFSKIELSMKRWSADFKANMLSHTVGSPWLVPALLFQRNLIQYSTR